MTATVDADVVLPHNLEAERATLGAVLVAPAWFPDVLAVISEAHFFREAHRDIFAAMRSILHSGRALDFITLKSELQQSGRLDDVGGPSYLVHITDGVPRSTNAPYYAQIVRDQHTAREAVRLCHLTTDKLLTDPGALHNGLLALIVTRGPASRKRASRRHRDWPQTDSPMRSLSWPRARTSRSVACPSWCRG